MADAPDIVIRTPEERAAEEAANIPGHGRAFSAGCPQISGKSVPVLGSQAKIQGFIVPVSSYCLWMSAACSAPSACAVSLGQDFRGRYARSCFRCHRNPLL